MVILMQKENRKVRSEYLLAALMCIAVALFLTILIAFNSCEVNSGEEEQSASSSADSSASDGSSDMPVSSGSSAPVTIERVELPYASVTDGLLALTTLSDREPPEGQDMLGGKLVNLYNENARRYSSESQHPYKYSGVRLQLREDPWKALNAMTEAFRSARGSTNIMVDKAYVENASSLSDQTLEADLTTGCAVMLSVYPADPDGDYLGSGKFLWLADNCTSYGYILRYPSEKAASTHVNGNARLFRYVGYEHAAYMGTYHLCLEEYLETVRNYTAEAPLAISYTDANGNERSCEVYFVAVSGDGTIELPIRGGESANFSYSGNGSDGIIVTCYLD